MKVVVIGATGLIGTKVVAKLQALGHQVIAASPKTGINTLTGEGLANGLANTNKVVDLTNSRSFDNKAVMEFFQTSGANLLSAEIIAGVQHHVALSLVGVDLMQNVGYMRAKKAQEDLIRQSGVPYTIVRSTQFFEFIKTIADQATEGNVVQIPDVQFQPIAAEDVANFVTERVLDTPVNGIMEIAGPSRFTMPEMVVRFLQTTNDPRRVVPNRQNCYFGAQVGIESLVPVGQAWLGTIDFERWLVSPLIQKCTS